MIWLNVILLVLAVALIASILLQNRSAGLGGVFGGGDGFYVRRGSEKRLWQIAVGVSALFILTAVAHLFI